MPPYIQSFIDPLLDPTAQVSIVGVCLLIMLDLLVGIVGAVMTKTFSSEKMRSGLLHKFTELSCIALGIILDGILIGGLNLGFEPVLLATCTYVAIMELGSVLELIRKYNPDAEGIVGWLTSFVQPKDSMEVVRVSDDEGLFIIPDDDATDNPRHIRGA